MSKIIKGKIVKKSGEQTIAVLVNRVKKHPIYQKRITVSTKYLVHDPDNSGKIGDSVEIKMTNPISKKKKYILSKILNND